MATTENYRQTQITTASPLQLIVMLYDECVRALKRAEEAFAIEGTDRIEQVNNNLLHAQDIITELAVSLDLEKGGQIAQNLDRIYDFMIMRLSHANTHKDLQAVVEVRELVTDLQDGWQQIADKQLPEEPEGNVAGQTGGGSILAAG